MGLSESVLRELASGNEDIDSIARNLSRTKKEIVNATQVLKRRELISSVTRSVIMGSPINRGKYVITELGKYWVAQGLNRLLKYRPVNTAGGTQANCFS